MLLQNCLMTFGKFLYTDNFTFNIYNLYILFNKCLLKVTLFTRQIIHRNNKIYHKNDYVYRDTFKADFGFTDF